MRLPQGVPGLDSSCKGASVVGSGGIVFTMGGVVGFGVATHCRSIRMVYSNMVTVYWFLRCYARYVLLVCMYGRS